MTDPKQAAAEWRAAYHALKRWHTTLQITCLVLCVALLIVTIVNAVGR